MFRYVMQREFCEIFFSLVFFFRFSSFSETLRLLFKKNRGTLIITPPPPSSQRVFESEMHVLCNDVPISRTTRTDGVAVYLWEPPLFCFPQRVPYCVCSRVFVRNF